MKRTEFKELYSFYRKVGRDFNELLSTANWPCGYDDMKCEQFDDHRNEWLDNNPIIKRVVEMIDSDDILEMRMNKWISCIKADMLYRRAS